MKHTMKKETKVEALARNNFGKTVRYRGQDFTVNEVRDYLGSNRSVSTQGIWIKAIEGGRVPKGDSQWVSYRWLRDALTA